ncbi:hypothetical protein BRE01_48820 [Brevibacillus reuszeri]|uniref:Uncharacterized protein n=1 Tax=Brevibacillus reuszeri TaxID=54915 RepID=A0A0K9YLF8_9BACL|nr:hypothetical protein [Brevibacillus reuszeri]KNB69492.1 hypothetical protein ADS79_26845 [Brevibacillus reuszeri]MED1861616.1 hypothetical protein [Brevibacillus reuszeri]GED71180.1 hypothetical protein BRE01_48820 [Brevibacillus reuszeri]
MLIMSKKSFQFDHPAGQEPVVVVRAHEFVEVPEWVKQSSMFKLASQAGDVTVTETKQAVKDAETGNKTKSAAQLKAEEKALKEAEEKAKAAAEAGQEQ